jgi:hypothetical protein
MIINGLLFLRMLCDRFKSPQRGSVRVKGLRCSAEFTSGFRPQRVIFDGNARRTQGPSIVGCSRDSGGTAMGG